MDGKSPFVQLLEAVHDVDGLERLRFTSPHPIGFKEDLIAAFARLPKLAEHVHLPLQSGSNRILKTMRRAYTAEGYEALVAKLRASRPGIALTTDVIVGFPGETDADFQTLCDFVTAAKFDRLGVFSYSDEDTSASYLLDAKVDARTIYNRKRRLMSIQKRISLARNRQLIGREMDVLLEGPSEEIDLLWQARLSTQAPEIDGICYINDLGEGEAAPGQIRRMRITEAHDYDLVGELIDAAPAEKPVLNHFPILATARHEMSHL